MKHRIGLVVLFLILFLEGGFAQNTVGMNVSEYTRLGIDFYAGGDIGGVTDGWNADLVASGIVGFFFSPRRIVKVDNIDISSYTAFCMGKGTNITSFYNSYIKQYPIDMEQTTEEDVTAYNRNLIIRLERGITGYFEKSGGVGVGIISGYASTGSFVTKMVPNPPFSDEEKNVFDTLTYIPVLLSFQHTFGFQKFRHLESNITNSSGYNRTLDFYPSTGYFGYRISGGPAFITNSDFDMGTDLPINLRIEILLGMADKKDFSYINATIAYNMMIPGASAIVDKTFFGSLSINWSILLSSKPYK